jgi:hypothetical protein
MRQPPACIGTLRRPALDYDPRVDRPGGDVRGDAALTARLLLRPTGLAGLAVTVGGAVAVLAATRPWYRAVADLTMLGEQQGRTVASLHGVPSTVLGWVAVAVGLSAVLLGAGIAIDRPGPHARRSSLGAAVALGTIAATAMAVRPALERVAGSDGGDLLELAGRLPSGVELAVTVRPGPGPLLLVLAAFLVGLGASVAREG